MDAIEKAVKQAMSEAIGETFAEMLKESTRDKKEYKEQIKRSFIASIKQAIKDELLTEDDLEEIIGREKQAAIFARLRKNGEAPVSVMFAEKSRIIALLAMTTKTVAKVAEIDEKQLLKNLQEFISQQAIEVGTGGSEK